MEFCKCKIARGFAHFWLKKWLRKVFSQVKAHFSKPFFSFSEPFFYFANGFENGFVTVLSMQNIEYYIFLHYMNVVSYN